MSIGFLFIILCLGECWTTIQASSLRSRDRRQRMMVKVKTTSALLCSLALPCFVLLDYAQTQCSTVNAGLFHTHRYSHMSVQLIHPLSHASSNHLHQRDAWLQGSRLRQPSSTMRHGQLSAPYSDHSSHLLRLRAIGRTIALSAARNPLFRI